MQNNQPSVSCLLLKFNTWHCSSVIFCWLWTYLAFSLIILNKYLDVVYIRKVDRSEMHVDIVDTFDDHKLID